LRSLFSVAKPVGTTAAGSLAGNSGDTVAWWTSSSRSFAPMESVASIHWWIGWPCWSDPRPLEKWLVPYGVFSWLTNELSPYDTSDLMPITSVIACNRRVLVGVYSKEAARPNGSVTFVTLSGSSGCW
jgi:hypothetical protein